MGKIKEDLKLIDYLKEKGISHDDLKAMIEESIDTALVEESEGNESESEPQEEVEQTEEVPTYTKDDIKDFISEEVKSALKIKRKVPSKGKTIKPEDVPIEKDIIKKNWFEVMV